MQRIEEGRLVLENHPFSLRQMVKATLRSFAAPLEEKHLTVEVILPSLDEFILQHAQKQQTTLPQPSATVIDIGNSEHRQTNTNTNLVSYASSNLNLALHATSDGTPSLPVTTFDHRSSLASGSSTASTRTVDRSKFGIPGCNTQSECLPEHTDQDNSRQEQKADSKRNQDEPVAITSVSTAPLTSNDIPSSPGASSLPRWCVQGDLYRLRQVLANIISNAIKVSAVNSKIIVALSIANLQLNHKFYEQLTNPTNDKNSFNLNRQPNHGDTSMRQTTTNGDTTTVYSHPSRSVASSPVNSSAPASPPVSARGFSSESVCDSRSGVPMLAPNLSVHSCLPVLGEAEFRLSVRDFGPGIAEADQANLFQGNERLVIPYHFHLLFSTVFLA